MSFSLLFKAVAAWQVMLAISIVNGSVRDSLLPMQLRQLQSDDYEFILSVVDEWWGGRPVYSLLQRLFFEHFNTTSFVLLDNERIVGFLIGFRSQSQTRVAYIHFVGIDPVYRGKGLGKTLYLHFFELMRSLGCTEIQCITSPVNKHSIAFHKAMGFSILPGNGVVDDIPVHKHHAGTDQHRVVFSRQLE